MTVTLTSTRISVEAGCCDDARELAWSLYNQLERGYEECAVLPVPHSVDVWRAQHRTARRRANRATNLGYLFHEIKREDYGHDIHLINISRDRRQGRPMSRGYREEQNFMPLPEYRCRRHAIRTYGVVDARGTLVAYLWLYRAGELALVSSILGHGEHEPNGVMQLLFQGVVGAEYVEGGYFVYNRWDSGGDGLRQAKGWLGFEPTEVQWAL